MKKLSFKKKINIGFGIVLSIMLIAMLYIIFQFNSVSNNMQMVYVHPFKVSNSIREIQIEIYKSVRLVRDIRFMDTKNQLDSLFSEINISDKLIKEDINSIYSQYLGNKSDIDSLFNNYNNWLSIKNKLYRLKSENKIDSLDWLLKYDNHKQVNKIIFSAKTISDFALQKADTTMQKSIAKKQQSFITILFVVLLAIILVLIISYLISKSINQPIKRFIDNAKAIFSIQAEETIIKFPNEETMFDYTINQLNQIYQEIEQQNEEIKSQNKQLAEFNKTLEDKINERTLELKVNEEKLIRQNQELTSAEKEIRASNEELVATSDALKLSNEELQLAKEKAEKSEEQFRILVDNTPDFIYSLDLESRHTAVNKSICEALGKDYKEIIGKNHKELGFPDEIVSEWRKLHMQIFDTGKQLKFETTTPMPDGSKKTYEVVLTPSFNENKIVTGIRGISRDITEQKQTEEKLINTSLLLKSSIESPKDMIILSIDKNYNYLYFNESHKASMVYAYGKDVKTGMNLLGCITNDEDKIKAKTNYDKALAGESHITIQEFGDIEKSYYETRYNPIFNDKNEIIGTTAFSADITERKRAEIELLNAKEKAEESDQLKTAFLENISHEVRTPMTAILGFSKLILKPNLAEENRKQFTDMLHKSTNQLLTIVDNSITLALIETKQLEINRMDFCPASLLSNLYNDYNHKKQIIEKSHIELILNKPEFADLQINNDYTRINQIFNILLDNAFKFTENGSIQFGYLVKDHKINFYVKDSGIGIPQDKQQIIFKSFTQADKNIRQSFGGLGVGLSIALGLVNLLEGELIINSQINEGTEIIFSLSYLQVTK